MNYSIEFQESNHLCSRSRAIFYSCLHHLFISLEQSSITYIYWVLGGKLHSMPFRNSNSLVGVELYQHQHKHIRNIVFRRARPERQNMKFNHCKNISRRNIKLHGAGCAHKSRTHTRSRTRFERKTKKKWMKLPCCAASYVDFIDFCLFIALFASSLLIFLSI